MQYAGCADHAFGDRTESERGDHHGDAHAGYHCGSDCPDGAVCASAGSGCAGGRAIGSRGLYRGRHSVARRESDPRQDSHIYHPDFGREYSDHSDANDHARSRELREQCDHHDYGRDSWRGDLLHPGRYRSNYRVDRLRRAVQHYDFADDSGDRGGPGLLEQRRCLGGLCYYCQSANAAGFSGAAFEYRRSAPRSLRRCRWPSRM